MRKLLIVIAVMVVYFLCLWSFWIATAHAEFNIQVKNESDYKINYLFYRVDHNIPDYYGPMNIAGGELKPGEDSWLIYKRDPGIYIYSWRIEKIKIFDYEPKIPLEEEKTFIVGEDVKKVILVIPTGLIMIK